MDTLTGLEYFYNVADTVGLDVDQQLATIVNNRAKNRLPDEKLKEKLANYLRKIVGSEDTDGLVKDVAAKKLDVELTKHDLVRSHRVGRKSEMPDTPRDVIVRFTTHNTKVAS